jgi:uncharacterized protein (DUF1810 family)
MKLYLLALGITLVSEIPIVAALFPGRRARMALVCALATTATHLALHFVFPPLLPARISPLFFGEAFATLAEAAAYFAFSRELGRSLVASALANTASYSIGLILFT